MLFFTVARKNSVWVRAILDSYESLGVLRSQDPDLDGERALMVFFLAPDMVGESLPVLEELALGAGIEPVEAEPALVAQLRSELGL
mgnify:CR=1 FL=1